MTNHRGWLRCAALALALALTLSANSSWAQDPGGEGAPVVQLNQGAVRPWARGVSLAKQERAAELFREGNGLLREGLFVQASEKYKAALKLWDHPGIRYNLALALLNLDQPLEVHEQLKAAMKYGPAPLDEQKFEQIKRYLLLIEKQLAPVEVRCDVPGAVVHLDGQFLFRAPGKHRGLVRPGQHTVTATKAGYATTRRTKTLLPGELTTFELEVYTSDELIHYKRRWPIWGPWTVTGLGAALLTTGAVLGVHAQKRFEDYDQRIERDPNCSLGCVPDDAVADRKSQGETLQRFSTISYVAGGTVMAGGIVLLILNRSVPYRIDPEGGDSAVTLSPSLGRSELGVVGSGRF